MYHAGSSSYDQRFRKIELAILCLDFERTFGEVNLACLPGRVHLYEGHSPERVVFGVRLLAALGCRAVLLTNAAGAIRRGLGPGDLMLIVDHINLMGRNPLVGADDSHGRRFPDLADAYDSGLQAAARRAARDAQEELHEGVYAAMLGPSYETPAEIRMVIQELKEYCRLWQITLCGGHTEITDAVTRPVVTGMMAGTVTRQKLIDKRNMAPGDRVLLTKGVAVEGTAIIASPPSVTSCMALVAGD